MWGRVEVQRTSTREGHPTEDGTPAASFNLDRNVSVGKGKGVYLATAAATPANTAGPVTIRPDMRQDGRCAWTCGVSAGAV